MLLGISNSHTPPPPPNNTSDSFQNAHQEPPLGSAQALLQKCGFSMGIDGGGKTVIKHSPQLGEREDVRLTIKNELSPDDLHIIMQALGELPQDDHRPKIVRKVLCAINNSLNSSNPPPRPTPCDQLRQAASGTARVLADNNLDPAPIHYIPEYIRHHHPLIVDNHTFDTHHDPEQPSIPIICREWDQVPANCPPSKYPRYYADQLCRFLHQGTPGTSGHDHIPDYCTDGSLPKVTARDIHNLYTLYQGPARTSVPAYLREANAMMVKGERLTDEAEFFGNGAPFKGNPVCLGWDQLPKSCSPDAISAAINSDTSQVPDYLQGMICKTAGNANRGKTAFVPLYTSMPRQCEQSQFTDFSYPQCQGYLAQVPGANQWPRDLQYTYCQWQADLDVSVRHGLCSQWDKIPDCGSNNNIKPSPWTDGQCVELFDTGKMGNNPRIPLYKTEPSYCSDNTLSSMTVRICDQMLQGTPMEHSFSEPRGAGYYGYCLELAKTQGIPTPEIPIIQPTALPRSPVDIPLVCKNWDQIPKNCHVYANVPVYLKDMICRASVTGNFEPKYDSMPDWCIDGSLPRVSQLDIDLAYAPYAGVSKDKDIKSYLKEAYVMFDKATEMAKSPRQSIFLQHELCSRWQDIPLCPYTQKGVNSPWIDAQCLYKSYMQQLGSNPAPAYSNPPGYCSMSSLISLTAADCDKMLEGDPIKSALDQKTKEILREQLINQLQTGKKPTAHPHILQYGHCLKKRLTEASQFHTTETPASTEPTKAKPLIFCEKELWREIPASCKMLDKTGMPPEPAELYTDTWSASEIEKGHYVATGPKKYDGVETPLYCTKLSAPSPSQCSKVNEIPWVAERPDYFQQAECIRQTTSEADINRPAANAPQSQSQVRAQTEPLSQAQAQTETQVEDITEAGTSEKILAIASAVMNLASFTSSVVNDRQAIRHCDRWSLANLGAQTSLLMSSLAGLGGAFGVFPIAAVTRVVMALNATSSTVISATAIKQLVQIAKDIWQLKKQSPDLGDVGRYVQGNIAAEKGVSTARQIMKLTGTAGQVAVSIASIMGGLTPAAATCTLMALYGTTWFGMAVDALKGRDVFLGMPLRQEGFTRTDAGLSIFALFADSLTPDEIQLFPPLVANTHTLTGRLGRQALTDAEEMAVFETIFTLGVKKQLWTKDDATQAYVDLRSVYAYCELEDWCTKNPALQAMLGKIADYRYQDKAFCDDDRGFGQNHVQQQVIMYFMNAIARQEPVDHGAKSGESLPLADMHGANNSDEDDKWFDAEGCKNNGACSRPPLLSVKNQDIRSKKDIFMA